MFLNVILTILVIVLIVISTGVYLWWKRYGSNLFKMMDTFKQGIPNIPKIPDMSKMPDIPSMPNLKNSVAEFKKAMDMLNKMNKK
jgi:hypothetical protein